MTFVWYPHVIRLQPIVLLFNAAGLGLFAVAGTQKALAFGVNPIVSALLSMLTGIGGGVLRDLLVNRFPWCCAPICTRWLRWQGPQWWSGAPPPVAPNGDDDCGSDPVFRHAAHHDPTRMECRRLAFRSRHRRIESTDLTASRLACSFGDT